MQQETVNQLLRKIAKGERARHLFDILCETLELEYTPETKKGDVFEALKLAVKEESESIAAMMKPHLKDPMEADTVKEFVELVEEEGKTQRSIDWGPDVNI